MRVVGPSLHGVGVRVQRWCETASFELAWGSYPPAYDRIRFRYLSGVTSTLDGMRLRNDIDAPSGRLVAAHRLIRKHGGDPSTSRTDEPLDERGTASDG